MEWENEDITRKMQYILNMRPVLNKDAFFSDGTRYYRNPTEPKAGETVMISSGPRKTMQTQYTLYPVRRNIR